MIFSYDALTSVKIHIKWFSESIQSIRKMGKLYEQATSIKGIQNKQYQQTSKNMLDNTVVRKMQENEISF